jgi:hypothetical protein
MSLSENCFKESTPDVQNWEIKNQIIASGEEISDAIGSLQGFAIPEYDEIDISYYGTTNNASTVVYSKDGSPVATLTLTYSVQPPIANDANLVNVTLS